MMRPWSASKEKKLMGVMRKALCAAVLGALALPGSAVAAETTSDVAGAVGSELSISAQSPGAMVMTRGAEGSTSSVVTVTSTHAAWTLSIRDDDPATPGRMDRVTGSGPSSLGEPLEWSLNGSGVYTNLSATPAAVRTGSFVESVQVDFRQRLTVSEDVAANETYKLTATYSVT
jgi:hypothetical protein